MGSSVQLEFMLRQRNDAATNAIAGKFDFLRRSADFDAYEGARS
jgi:hypothetical protein